MLAQIAETLIDAVSAFFVFALLARFHMQWLRVSFRNQVGQFVIAVSNWIVLPARRVVPALAGFDLATLTSAWLLQALGLFLIGALRGMGPAQYSGAALAALLLVALVDLLRYSLYILSFAVVVQAVLSWINPYTPLGPVFDAFTRPFLRPLQRRLPLIANVDLSPLVLLVLLQVLLIPVWYLRALAGGIG